MASNPIPPGYHLGLTIGGVEYLFSLPRPETQLFESSLNSFAQRMATGALTLTDLEHIAAVEQTDFHGGFGQHYLIEQSRYRSATRVDTRTPGVASLVPAMRELPLALSMPLSPYRLSAVAVGSGLFVAGYGGVFHWDGSTLRNVTGNLPSSNVGDLLYNGESLFVAVEVGRIHRWTGTVGSSHTWVAVAPVIHDALTFALHGGLHWWAQDSSNLLHFWTAGDGSDAVEAGISDTVSPDHPLASPTGDPGAVQVGTVGETVRRLVSYGDALYAFRNDGIWRVVETQRQFYDQAQQRVVSATEWTAYRAFEDYTPRASASNFLVALVHEGALIFNVGPKLYRAVGSTVSDITPPLVNETFPPNDIRFPKGAFSLMGTLYVWFESHLYAMGASGDWHHLYTLESQVAHPYQGVFAYRKDSGGQGTQIVGVLVGASTARLLAWQWIDGFPRAPHVATGRLETSWFDAGFAQVEKHWSRLHVKAVIPTTGSRIVVSAFNRTATGSEKIVLGEITGDAHSGLLYIDGEYVWNPQIKSFSLPVTSVGRALSIRFDFERATNNAGAASPLLYGYLLEYVPRPPAQYGFNLQLKLHDQMAVRGGLRDPYSALEKYHLLRQAFESRSPLAYRDWMGNHCWVYCTTFRGQPRLVETEQGAARNDAYEVGLSLLIMDRTVSPPALSGTIPSGAIPPVEKDPPGLPEPPEPEGGEGGGGATTETGIWEIPAISVGYTGLGAAPGQPVGLLLSLVRSA